MVSGAEITEKPQEPRAVVNVTSDCHLIRVWNRWLFS